MYLRKSYLYNSIMKDVSYSLKQILDETLGSLYLNDKEKSIVDKIFNDIDTEKYKNNPAKTWNAKRRFTVSVFCFNQTGTG